MPSKHRDGDDPIDEETVSINLIPNYKGER